MQRVVQWSNQILSGIVLQAVNALKTSFSGGQPSFAETVPGSVADCISGLDECQLKWERWQSPFMCVCVCMVRSMGVYPQVRTSSLYTWAFFENCSNLNQTNVSFLNLHSSSTYRETTVLMCPTCVLCPINTLYSIGPLVLYSNSNGPMHITCNT